MVAHLVGGLGLTRLIGATTHVETKESVKKEPSYHEHRTSQIYTRLYACLQGWAHKGSTCTSAASCLAIEPNLTQYISMGGQTE